MNITKLGHCCLLIEEQGKVIMTDPGAWTTEQNTVKGVDVILITHEHPDHFHLESLKAVLLNNPKAVVVTNSRVGNLLVEAGIPCTVLEDSQTKTLEAIEIAGFGSEHASIYPGVPNVINTGFLIAKRFFYPGDALTIPDASVEILALPVAGPWIKISEAIDYAKSIKPAFAFPVHDGMLKITTPFHALPARFLGEAGIQFDVIEVGTLQTYS